MRTFGHVIGRLWEFGLFLVGAVFVFGEWDALDSLALMTLWDLMALVHVGVGLAFTKISLMISESGSQRPDWLARSRLGSRLGFVFGVMASLTGLTAATHAVFDDVDDLIGAFVNGAAVAAIVLAWILLHASYADFYHALYARGAAGGLDFPDTARPRSVDMLYFAFTIGTNLSVSDVRVTTRRMRWHVVVHSVVSFFYNAAVLATAIRLVTD